MTRTGRRLVAVVALGVSGSLLFLGLTAPAAVASNAPQEWKATTTGATSVTTQTIGGVVYQVATYNTNGTFTFTPAQAMAIEYLVVAGGGGGGRSAATNLAGGGGGGGGVLTNLGSPTTITTAALTLTVGNGGAGSTNSTTQTANGSNSSITGTGFTSVTAVGGGGGGASGSNAAGPGRAGGSGGGGSSRDSFTAGGAGTAGQGNAGAAGRSAATDAGGGGGGAGAVGGSPSSGVGGNGGAGVASTITGTSVTYGGGGGGSAPTTGGTGADGGGNGGRTGSLNGTAGVANRGGGGGASFNAGTGGAGGRGVIIIRWRKFGGGASPPTSAALNGSTLSWGAPTYVPPGQTLASYAVQYRLASRTGTQGWAIYARGGTGTSLTIANTAQGCTTANAGWTCSLLDGALVSGTSYSFRVFARTATSLGQASATFTYVAP